MSECPGWEWLLQDMEITGVCGSGCMAAQKRILPCTALHVEILSNCSLPTRALKAMGWKKND